jgi:DNA-binding SARP family transcriptional activator/tetratricopeptide (TPR) repeat protein
VEFRVLGPVEIRVAGQRLPAGHARQRAVLAVLLLELNRVVPAEQLIDRVWGEDPPPSGRNTLYVYVAKLRAIIAAGGEPGAALVRRPGGYSLEADPDRVDLVRFRRLAREASSAGAGEDAEALLRGALGLWQGAALSGLTSPWLAAMRETLEAERTAAVLDLNDIALRRGAHAALIGELTGQAAAHPADERLIGQLMLALYRTGRQADALHWFDQTRQLLAAEFGASPGPELRDLHQRMLRNDPSLARSGPDGDGAAADPGGNSPQPVVPRQLPAPVEHFAGRAAELRVLNGLLHRAAQGAAIVISAVSGTAGVGKTALAVHWAHQVADQFPDGQLYVNLRGFDPVAKPVRPAEAIRGLLQALVRPAGQIPAGPQAQQDMYRSVLAARRVLIVLDNARDAAQVRPLLAGGRGSLVLVTSRNQLLGLAAADGAWPVRLDVLSGEDARALLRRRLGAARLAAEPGAVDELIELCARLPLALSIAAARGCAHPAFPLAALAAELQDVAQRLDALDGGDPAASVRAVLSWSARSLTGPAARMFRLLAVHPGPDFSVPAAASLAGLPAGRARLLLGELADANLLTEHAPGRFSFHDLLRGYAGEQANALDSETGRLDALHRLADYYLHAAHRAERLLYPDHPRPALEDPRPGVTTDDSAGSYATALAWFDAEHRVLVAVVAAAADHRFDTQAWQLAWVLDTFFELRAAWRDWEATQRTALAAARRLGNRFAEFHAARGAASAQLHLGRYPDALSLLSRALRLSEEDGDLGMQARIHMDMCRVFEAEERYPEALRYSRDGLRLARQAGAEAKRVEADALNFVGWYLAQLGRFGEALECCQQALIMHHFGDKNKEPHSLDSLACVHRGLGRYAAAAECYRRAVELFAGLGKEWEVARTLAKAAEVHQEADDLPAAIIAWTRALAIFERLHQPEAEQVRARLAECAPPAARQSGDPVQLRGGGGSVVQWRRAPGGHPR